MDEYASSGEENEIAVGEVSTSYLDDDDVQLREGEISLDERDRSSAVELEEEMSRLRSLFKGIFKTCSPKIMLQEAFYNSVIQVIFLNVFRIQRPRYAYLFSHPGH